MVVMISGGAAPFIGAIKLPPQPVTIVLHSMLETSFMQETIKTFIVVNNLNL